MSQIWKQATALNVPILFSNNIINAFSTFGAAGYSSTFCIKVLSEFPLNPLLSYPFVWLRPFYIYIHILNSQKEKGAEPVGGTGGETKLFVYHAWTFLNTKPRTRVTTANVSQFLIDAFAGWLRRTAKHDCITLWKIFVSLWKIFRFIFRLRTVKPDINIH